MLLVALVTTVLLHPYDVHPAPALTLVEAAGDTVWFSAPATDWAPAVSYGYVRASREWLRVAGAIRARQNITLPAGPGDTVAVAPGYVLIREPDDAEGRRGACVLIATRDGRRFPVLADLSTAAARATLRTLLGRQHVHSHGDTLPPISSSVTAVARDDGGIWFGFDGGEYEAMEGDLGVLLRFDMSRQTFETLVTPEIASAHVSGLAVAGGRLWVGTQYPHQLEGMVGERGLLVLDLATRAWTTAGLREGALSGDLVHTVIGDGGTLWVTNDGGISRLELRGGGWTSSYFALTMRGDTAVHELLPARPTHPQAAATILTLATLLDAPRRAFWDAASTLPAARFDFFVSLDDEEWDIAGAPSALAHPALLPFLRDAVRRGGAARDVAVEALGLLGAADALPIVRAAFDSSRGSQRIAAAIALGRLGDVAGLTYLRARLADTVPDGEDDTTIGAVIQGAVSLGDRESLALLRPWLKTTTGGPAVFNFYADRADLAAWRRLAREARDRPVLWAPLLVRVRHCDSACRDPVDDPEVQATVSDVARRALLDTRYRENWGPAAVAVRYGDAAMMPYLIAALTMGYDRYAASVRALIRLTGVDSVPAPLEPNAAEQLRAQRFFAAWWSSHERGFRAVPKPVGEAALLRWYDRAGRQSP